MKTKTITLYQFSELSDEAKEKAIETLRDINVDYPDWDDFMIDYWQDRLNKIGFENAKIRYSGFCSQGDGASFAADVNIEKLLSAMVYCATKYENARIFELVSLLRYKNAINIHLSRGSSNYSHERTISVNVDIDYPYERGSFWPKIVEQFENALDDFRIDLCSAIYKSLENEYNYLTSEEAIIETIEANKYDFLENGKIA